MNFRVALLLAIGASSSIACVPSYEPPTLDQPHALVKIRRTYEMTAGTTLREAVDIEERAVLRERASSRLAKEPRDGAILAHPITGTFVVRADFSHIQLEQVQETYRESKTTYRMESYFCSSGFGTTSTLRTCYHSVPHTEYETKYRTVWRNVEHSDGSCSRAIRFTPEHQHVYLLQYTYHAPSACSLSCFEQIVGADGTFKAQRCAR